MWSHGLPLTPTVPRWFGCTAGTVQKPVTLIISAALDHPWGRICLKSRGRGPIDPNWKCHFSARATWRCCCGLGRADANSTSVLRFIVWYSSRISTPPTSAQLGGCVALNRSARKLQQHSKIEVTVQERTNWNRLFWNLQAFTDTCWAQHIVSGLLPPQPLCRTWWMIRTLLL